MIDTSSTGVMPELFFFFLLFSSFGRVIGSLVSKPVYKLLIVRSTQKPIKVDRNISICTYYASYHPPPRTEDQRWSHRDPSPDTSSDSTGKGAVGYDH